MAYQNTFRANTPIGQGLQNLANTLFGGGPSPNDMAAAAARAAQTDNYRASAAQTREETRQMADAFTRRNSPVNQDLIASTQTGIPVREVDQYRKFATGGVPYARPNIDAGQESQLGNILAGQMMMDTLTGKTNLEQFNKGVAVGSENDRVADVVGGNMPVKELAAIQSAIKGNDTFKVAGGLGFDPQGGAGDVTVLPTGEANINQSNAAAKASLASALKSERGTATKPRAITSTDRNSMINTLGALIESQDLDPTGGASTLFAELQRAANAYLSDPNSPVYGNPMEAANLAFEDAIKTRYQWGLLNDTEAVFNPVTVPTFGGSNDQGMAGGITAAEPPDPTVMDELPDPVKNDGRTIKDDETGATYKAVNGRWVQLGT